MSKTQHTPGLWTAQENEDDEIEITTATRDGMIPICRVETGFIGKIEDEQQANARLIAAAPDLAEAAAFAKAALEALAGYEADYGEALPDDYEIGRIEDSRSSASFRLRVGHIRKLAAAIAKATGEGVR